MNDCRSEEEFGLYICWSQSISPLQCRSALLHWTLKLLLAELPLWQNARAPCNTDVQSGVDLVVSWLGFWKSLALNGRHVQRSELLRLLSLYKQFNTYQLINLHRIVAVGADHPSIDNDRSIPVTYKNLKKVVVVVVGYWLVACILEGESIWKSAGLAEKLPNPYTVEDHHWLGD